MKPYFETELGKLYCGDCLEVLSSMESESIQSCITSPPYWGLRDYGVDGQLGLEKTPEEYVSKMVEIFREVKRVLKKDGTLWLNLGDSYATHGSSRGKGQFNCDMRNDARKARMRKKIPATHIGLKEKDLVGIPRRVAFALQADGWYLRQDIIWHKPNPMPESVTDRCTKSHEYIFLMSKSAKYYYDNEAIKETAVCGEARPDGIVRDRVLDYDSKEKKLRPSKKRGEFGGKWKDKKGQEGFRAIREKRNKRSVWTITTRPYKEAHFATFPEALILPCVLAGTAENDVILDPFMGSGTVGMVCEKYNRKWQGIELNNDYCEIAKQRIINETRQQKLPGF